MQNLVSCSWAVQSVTQKWAGHAQLGSEWWEWSLTGARLRLPWADSQLAGELTGCASSWRDRGLAAAALLDGGLLELHLPEWREGKVFNLVFLPCV